MVIKLCGVNILISVFSDVVIFVVVNIVLCWKCIGVVFVCVVWFCMCILS